MDEGDGGDDRVTAESGVDSGNMAVVRELYRSFSVRGGRVTRFEQFTDTLMIARAMGPAG